MDEFLADQNALAYTLQLGNRSSGTVVETKYMICFFSFWYTSFDTLPRDELRITPVSITKIFFQGLILILVYQKLCASDYDVYVEGSRIGGECWYDRLYGIS